MPDEGPVVDSRGFEVFTKGPDVCIFIEEDTVGVSEPTLWTTETRECPLLLKLLCKLLWGGTGY